ncbi:hypothetical protein ACFQ8W_21150 [Streptomyces sp. NPDC056508]|uniref:hypothetical protein n=1 Tax=Streptomyces sp. NPDC056508 TaxID=3345845 RepID=UPI0036828898
MDSRPVASKPSNSWDAFDEMLTALLRAAQSGETSPGATPPLKGLDISLERVVEKLGEEPVSTRRISEREVWIGRSLPKDDTTWSDWVYILMRLAATPALHDIAEEASRFSGIPYSREVIRQSFKGRGRVHTARDTARALIYRAMRLRGFDTTSEVLNQFGDAAELLFRRQSDYDGKTPARNRVVGEYLRDLSSSNAVAHTLMNDERLKVASYVENDALAELREFFQPNESFRHQVTVLAAGAAPKAKMVGIPPAKYMFALFDDVLDLDERTTDLAPRAGRRGNPWSLADSLPTFEVGVILITGLNGVIGSDAIKHLPWPPETTAVVAISTCGVAEDLIQSLNRLATRLHKGVHGPHLFDMAARELEQSDKTIGRAWFQDHMRKDRRDHALNPLSCPRLEKHNALPCPLCEETQSASTLVFNKLNHRGILPRSHGKLLHVYPEAKRVFAETLNAMFHSLDVSPSEFARRGGWEAASIDIWITGVLIPPRKFIDLVVKAYEEKRGSLGEEARTHLLALYVEAHEANQSEKT